MSALPKTYDLSETIPSLPSGSKSQLVSCRPISGSSFTAQNIIEVDIPTVGWMDAKSLAMRYKVTYSTDASGSAVIGTPLYTPFARCTTLIGGSSIDTIQQFSQVAHVLTNVTNDIAYKYGVQSGLGYTQPATDVSGNGNMQYLDGANLPPSQAGTEYTVAGPLVGLVLANSTKSLPLFCMPSIRLQFSMDSLSNMFFVSTGALNVGYSLPTAFAISNFEITYLNTDLGQGVEQMVYNMGREITIKSHGYSNSAVNVAAATSGSQSFVFNQRFASIRTVFICPNRADGNGNKWGEITDLTSGNGDYQLIISNSAYPQLPLSTKLNRSGILQETRRSVSSLYDNTNGMAINTNEFNNNINDTSGNLLYYEPSKFIAAVGLEKCDSNHALLSGVSTTNSPIQCVVNIGTATSFAANLNLICAYDAILVLDPVNRQMAVRA